MPSYVIMQESAGRIGDTVEAILCDLNAAGSPDRGTDVPVRVRRISEKTLYVDDEPRRIIWGVGENGAVTFLVDGGKGVRNRERRVALAQASGLLQQLTSTLMALAAESAEPELVAETLRRLFDWITRERERAEGDRHDHAQ
jgi:hypothetical protein